MTYSKQIKQAAIQLLREKPEISNQQLMQAFSDSEENPYILKHSLQLAIWFAKHHLEQDRDYCFA